MKALTYPVCLQVSQTPALEGAQCSSQEEILIRRDNWQIFFFLCMQCIHARVSSWCSFKPTKDNKLPQQGRKSGTSWRKGAPTLCSDDLKPTIQCDKTLWARDVFISLVQLAFIIIVVLSPRATITSFLIESLLHMLICLTCLIPAALVS